MNILNQPLLTIGIPVYNGERFIKQTMESILPQLTPEVLECVEVIISDNCSTDATGSLVLEYVNNFDKHIKYFRNDRNYFYDGNIDLVVERSLGKYVWLLGCGEIVKPDALKLILRHLENNDYDNILLGFDIYSEITKQIESESQDSVTEDKIFYDKNDFLNCCGLTSISAVSINIVAKSSWEMVSLLPLREVGWCHVERIKDILFSENYMATLVIPNQCFTLYREVEGWWSVGDALLVNTLKFALIVQSTKCSSTSKWYRLFFEQLYPIRLVNLIIKSKKMDSKFSITKFKMVARLFYGYLSFWLVIVPILILPNLVFRNNFLMACGKTIFQKCRWVYKLLKKNSCINVK